MPKLTNNVCTPHGYLCLFGIKSVCMPAYIRKIKRSNGAVSVQIEYKHGRKRTGITHIGTAHNDSDIKLLSAFAYGKVHENQLSFNLIEQSSVHKAKLRKSYSKVLWNALDNIYCGLGFEVTADSIFKQLVLARIIEPASKIDTIRILRGLGLQAPSNTAVHRCLKRIVEENYRGQISTACFRCTMPTALTLVLYDVTTLYFEVQKEDEFRKPGLSKERRLEPQITIGLLVDSTGFPLEIQSFEGNRAEVKTIAPVLAGFKERHGIEDITVTADAAMLSSNNIEALESLGYHYIIGSKLAKTPYEIDIGLSGIDKFTDEQIFESQKTMTVCGRQVKRREIFQYREKRASLDLLNIDKLLVKARKIIEKETTVKHNRFLKITDTKMEVNVALVEEARRRAGIKGYLTDLDIPAQQVINAYHQLFHVEKAFRMSKSDLKARPIFHHKRESIEAHLTIVFAALAVAHRIETKTGVSIKKFVRMLEPVRTGIISMGNKTFELDPEISVVVMTILKNLPEI